MMDPAPNNLTTGDECVCPWSDPGFGLGGRQLSPLRTSARQSVSQPSCALTSCPKMRKAALAASQRPERAVNEHAWRTLGASGPRRAPLAVSCWYCSFSIVTIVTVRLEDSGRASQRAEWEAEPHRDKMTFPVLKSHKDICAEVTRHGKIGTELGAVRSCRRVLGPNGGEQEEGGRGVPMRADAGSRGSEPGLGNLDVFVGCLVRSPGAMQATGIRRDLGSWGGFVPRA